MKRSTTILIVAFFLNSVTAFSQEVKVMEYNVGSQNWADNRDSVVARIVANDPDVFSIHEAGPQRRLFLQSQPELSNYRLLRVFDTMPYLTATHVFLRRNTFEVIDSGYVEAETYGGYTGLGRYVNWAKFQHTISGRQFLFYASHFVSTFVNEPDSAAIGQFRHAKEMVDLMDQHASLNIPQITVGDFNADSSSEVMQFLQNQMSITYNSTTIDNPAELDDSWYVANPGLPKPGTVAIVPGNRAIDWILVSTNTNITGAGIDTGGVNISGEFPSDHFPLWASFELTDPTSISEIPNEVMLTVFPNPTASSVSFNFELSKPIRLTLEILDLQGRVLKTVDKSNYTGSHNSITVDLSDLPGGFYCYRLIHQGEVISGVLIRL
jgi:endonuclease/exonuclease/phosphatase family metal-dependent hydrolase